MKLFIVVASAGRPQVVSDLAQWCQRLQTPSGCEVGYILSTPTPEDAPADLPSHWQQISGRRGLTAQRNAALAALPDDTDYLCFFDDDALPREDYLIAVTEHLEAFPSHVAITARLLRDGVVEKAEISAVQARAELEASYVNTEASAGWTPIKELYGCGFAVRWSALSLLRFEERFPLYSWLEDLDYSRQAMLRGEMVKLNSAVAVHRGVTSGGRTQHLRLGYSQVANPALLVNKHTLPLGIALAKTLRPVARNVIGALVGTQIEERRDRLRGNWMALSDLIAAGGKATPERILEL